MQISHKLPLFSPGFTLIELIVTISIGLLLFGGAMAGFLQFQERRKVEMTARDIQQLYVTARQKAQAREVPEGYGGATSGNCRNQDLYRLAGYAVKFSSGTFTIVPKCGEIIDLKDGTVAETYTPPSLTIAVNDPEVIFYSIPSSGNTNLGANSMIQVQAIDGGITYRFTISPSGAISDVVKQP